MGTPYNDPYGYDDRRDGGSYSNPGSSYRERYDQASRQQRPRRGTPLDTQEFMTRVFGWMALGLGIAGAVAMIASQIPAVFGFMVRNSWIFFALWIVEIFMINGIYMRIQKMSFGAAAGSFLLLTTLFGISLTPIVWIYTGGSIAGTFLATAGTFGFMFVWGWTTKKDLSGWTAFLIPAVLGIVLASVINSFLQSEGLSMIVTYVGIPLFCGVAVFKANQIKQIAINGPADSEQQNKLAVLGATSLFVTFFNLFILMLNLFGVRR